MISGDNSKLKTKNALKSLFFPCRGTEKLVFLQFKSENTIMLYQDNQYIKAQDLSFSGILHDIRKSKIALQPVFEAFTNALEAIKIRQKGEKTYKGKIVLKLFKGETFVNDVFQFERLSITDNGIGFNEEEFKRFNTFKLTNKGIKNLGSGRIQYVHFFGSTCIKSIFQQDTEYFEREFVVSKKENFLRENAIVKHLYCRKVEAEEIKTTVTFKELLSNNNAYSNLDDQKLKEELLERYIHYFCYNKETLPEIEIEYYLQSELKSQCKISEEDIPNIDKTEKININYSSTTPKGLIKRIDKTEEFTIDAFRISQTILKENKLNLVSKGEVIEGTKLSLEDISNKDTLDGDRFLFLVSSDYITSRDTDERGVLNIPEKNTFGRELFDKEEDILLEDIKDSVNSAIGRMYPEVEEIKKEHQENIQQLKQMFLIGDDTAKDIHFSVNDKESDILKKFYEAEAEKQAMMDAKIKESIDSLNDLDPNDVDYNEDFKKIVDGLATAIPMQNKKNLTHYVARRKLVIELFEKILNRQLGIQKGANNYDEALIHNLLFQRGSTDTGDSNLWLVNEDFIYFKGNSEKRLSALEFNGEKLFKEVFSEEEEHYLNSLGEHRILKRPDILLFPEEGKCIIIEFKAPHVNASDHLTQIDKYASLIRNYTEDKFQITTFYGYLLGEHIEPKDVLAAVSAYEYSYQFDYLYRPSIKVTGFDGRTNGSIYTEVIKYSTLVKRAKQRNSIFIDKLMS